MSILLTKDYKRFKVGEATFEGAERAGRALPGDKVILKDGECELVERCAHPLLSGILELTSKYMYGMTSRGSPLYLFRPLNESYPPFIVGSSEKNRTRNILILVKFECWDDHFPRGVIQEVLGPVGFMAAEKLALEWRYSPYRYNSKTPKEAPIDDNQVREEITTSCIFNIDPPGCKDIDDVISIDYEKQEFGITIADVSEYIKILDSEALKRGATLYQDGCAIRPMLPANLSEDLCSLVAGQRRLGVTLFIDLQNGSRRWAKTVLINRKSYTYSAKFPENIKNLLSSLSQSADPHVWVEWAMLEYNKEAGRFLKGVGRGVLRRHSGWLDKWKDIDKSILKYIAMESAEYCLASEENSDHQMIETDAYAHASSPLRRYCDLINQRILKGANDIVTQSTVDWLNVRQKEIKKHDRDLCFLEAVSYYDQAVEGIVLDDLQIFVKEWKRVIKCNHHLQAGQSAQIHWFVDWSRLQWKHRLVFSVSLLAA